MATELTVKERAFAQLIIEGTKTAAYRKVYSGRGTPATTAVAAYRLSRRPKIKTEVERLLRQRELPADDYRRIRAVAVAGLTEIFLQNPDPRLRAKVGSLLLGYADAGLKFQPAPPVKTTNEDELDQLVDEILRIQRRAAGQGPEPLTLEMEVTDVLSVQAEPGDQPAAAEDLTTSEPTDDAPCASGSSEADSRRPEPKQRFERVPIPGTFPIRFRRVRVS
jgi:hypothetical protein